MTTTNNIPPLGFGTFGRTGPEGIEAILSALETGYRHLDTAQSYGTEQECGEAMRRSGLARDEIFITTKITGENCKPGALIPSLKRSNETIGVDAVNLTLIHWSVTPSGKLPMADYINDLVEAQQAGLTGMIGVSNFTIADLDEAESIIGPGKLANNQFERHPLLQNQKLVDACGARGIAVTCYLPLARGACAGIAEIEAIARAHDATPHQIALAFSLNEGHIVIPTSGKTERIRENFGAASIKLTADELATIRGSRPRRAADQSVLEPRLGLSGPVDNRPSPGPRLAILTFLQIEAPAEPGPGERRGRAQMRGISGIGHVALKVYDLDRSLDFYVNKLGFAEMMRMNKDDGSLWLVYLRITDTQFLEIFPGADTDRSPGWNGNAITHICLEVDDLDSVVDDIEKAGIKLIIGKKTSADRNKQAWVEDPDGNRIELMQIAPDSLQRQAIERLKAEAR